MLPVMAAMVSLSPPTLMALRMPSAAGEQRMAAPLPKLL